MLRGLWLAVASAPEALALPGTRLLTRASDSALDQLAKPGAFSADKSISIGLPGVGGIGGGLLGQAMALGGKMGVAPGLSDGLNRAAEAAAGEAKPIFGQAIDKMTVRDAARIATGGAGSGTRCLEQSSGDMIRAKMRPPIEAALGRTGAFQQLGAVRSLGIGPDQLTDHVSKSAAGGIFKNMAAEESKLRANPMGVAKSVLGKVHF